MPDTQKDWLLSLGAALFLLGLVTGLMPPLLHNPRMGLSAHLEGIMNGTFLLAVGAIWDRINLGPRMKAAAFILYVFGTIANWATTLLASIWGTSGLTPIAGAGYEGTPVQETVVTALLLALSLAMIVATALVLVGLLRKRA